MNWIFHSLSLHESRVRTFRLLPHTHILYFPLFPPSSIIYLLSYPILSYPIFLSLLCFSSSCYTAETPKVSVRVLRARTLHRDYLYPDFFFFFFLFLFSLFSLSPPVPHLSLVIHHLNLYTNSSPYLLLLQLHTTQTRTACGWEGLFLSPGCLCSTLLLTWWWSSPPSLQSTTQSIAYHPPHPPPPASIHFLYFSPLSFPFLCAQQLCDCDSPPPLLPPLYIYYHHFYFCCLAKAGRHLPPSLSDCSLALLLWARPQQTHPSGKHTLTSCTPLSFLSKGRGPES